MTQQRHVARWFVGSFGATLALLGLSLVAQAAPAAPAAAAPAAPPSGEYAPVPPNVEDAPVAVQGGYCYGGPHPADPAHSGGATWDETQGRHVRPYPPLDLRLFAVQDGCYYFIGDPSDFGYRGQTYSYYGAHPVHAGHGGGWCFMIGGHAHGWQPWSPHFVVAGPWFYWQGPYDPFFWNYWPYYAVYYHHYYPHYYRGGRYYNRGGGFAHRGGRNHGAGFGRGGRGAVVAPPIGRVPAPVGATAATRAAMPAGGGGWGARPTGPTTSTRGLWPGAVTPRAEGVWGTRAQPSAASTFRSNPSPSPGWGSVRSAPSPAPTRATPSAGSFFRGSGNSGGSSSGPRLTAPSAGRTFRR